MNIKVGTLFSLRKILFSLIITLCAIVISQSMVDVLDDWQKYKEINR